jgi:hypothetical protein
MKKNYRISEDTAHSLKDESTLVLVNMAEDDECIYEVNGLGVRIFLGLKENRTVEEIKKEILDEFDVAEARLDRDVAEFLEFLETNKLAFGI